MLGTILCLLCDPSSYYNFYIYFFPNKIKEFILLNKFIIYNACFNPLMNIIVFDNDLTVKLQSAQSFIQLIPLYIVKYEHIQKLY